MTLPLAGCLLIAVAIAPVTAYAEPALDSVPLSGEQHDIEDEDPDTADDGSSTLPDMFRLYDLQDIEPISAQEEEVLLGNWGDSDVEDGD